MTSPAEKEITRRKHLVDSDQPDYIPFSAQIPEAQSSPTEMASVQIRFQPTQPDSYFTSTGPVEVPPSAVRAGVPLNELLNKLDTPGAGDVDRLGRFVCDADLPTPPASSISDSCVLPALRQVDEDLTTSELDVKGGVPAADGSMVKVFDTPINELIIQEIIRREAEQDESAFFVGDLASVYSAVRQWRASPIGDRVEIFYAVKCNPSPAVVHLLSLMGTSFDCASVAEIDIVMNSPNRPSPDRIIFANPCKPASFIRSAQRSGVEMMTFDNADELYKISRCHPEAKLVLRILTDDSKSLCRLGLKYGAPLSTCPGLISLARSLRLNIIGVSFHVGSGCKDPAQFTDAVWRAKRVFEMGKKEGYEFKFLDVGGGFEREGFELMSGVLRDSLEEHFPTSEGVRVVAEPGRFLVSTAFTLATNIIARRKALAMDENSSVEAEVTEPIEAGEEAGADVMYYINDGVYGSFNCIMFDHQIVHPYPLTIAQSASSAIPRLEGPPPPNVHLAQDLTLTMGYSPASMERASVWGPSCDGIDCVRQLVDLPKGLQVGDWLGWGEMGAYTLCAASRFNGFDLSEVVWTTGGVDEGSSEVRRILDSF